jgi:hypothetical protein
VAQFVLHIKGKSKEEAADDNLLGASPCKVVTNGPKESA